jgi:WD40 repeat protein
VAIKTIRRGRLSPDMKARFLREQKVLARLHQTHIVSIHSAGQEGPLEFFSMPFIDGAALSHLVRAVNRLDSSGSGGGTPSLGKLARMATDLGTDPGVHTETFRDPASPTSTDDSGRPSIPHNRSWEYFLSVARVMADVADAVQHAHDVNILHRDIKPSNIMVDVDEQSWIIDFGLAGCVSAADQENGGIASDLNSDEQLSSATGFIGTSQYMAPEQFDGKPDVRSDVWGLGVTLYELLTSHRAFDGENLAAIQHKVTSEHPPAPRSLVPDLPRDLEAVCLKAMRKESGSRYGSAAEFGNDLRRWLRGEPTVAHPTRPLRRAWLWSKRNRGWAGTIYGGLAIVAALLATIWQYKASENAARVDAAEAEAGVAESRTEVAESKAAAEAANHRTAMLSLLQQISDPNRRSGWREKAWQLVRKSKSGKNDAVFRDQATALLRGLDAVQFKAFPFHGFGFAFHPDGKQVLIASADGKTRLWNSDTDGTTTWSVARGGPVAFRSGRPMHVLAGAGPGTLVLRDLEGSKQLLQVRMPAAPANTTLKAIDLQRGVVLASNGSRFAAIATFCDPKDKQIVSGRVVVWDATSAKPVRQFELVATSIALTPDGRYLATGQQDGHITVWSLADGKEHCNLHSAHITISALAFGRDWLSRPSVKQPADEFPWQLAAGDKGANVTIWDLNRRGVRAHCDSAKHAVHALAFQGDGSRLAISGRGNCSVYDAGNGRKLLSLGAADYSFGVAMSPDGSMLILGTSGISGRREHVTAFRMIDGRGIRTLRGLKSGADTFVYSRDSSRIAGLTHDWHIGVWETATGRTLRVFAVDEGDFVDNASLALSPDGTRLAYASKGVARLLDVATGRSIGTWTLPPGLGNKLAFTADGKELRSYRLERTSGKLPPIPWNHDLKDPRVLRFRRLIPQKPPEELWSFPGQKGTSFANTRLLAMLGQICDVDGSICLTDAVWIDAARKPSRQLVALSGKDGKIVWSHPGPLKQPMVSYLRLGPDSRFVWTYRDRASETGQLVDLHTGKSAGELPYGLDSLSANARYWIKSSGGVSHLYRRGSNVALTRLGFDRHAANNSASFSPDGRLIAWSNSDGSVSLFDIQRVRRRLTSIKLGW